MAKPKLLFLGQTLPYPPDSGTAIRSYNVLRLLARDYDVTALCFYRRATTPDLDGSLAALRANRVRCGAVPDRAGVQSRAHDCGSRAQRAHAARVHRIRIPERGVQRVRCSRVSLESSS